MGDGVHDMAMAFSDAAMVYAGSARLPPVALAWLDEHLDVCPRRRVVDLGAGTGKLTRGVVEHGATVLAMEPVEGMRRRIADAFTRHGASPPMSKVWPGASVSL